VSFGSWKIISFNDFHVGSEYGICSKFNRVFSYIRCKNVLSGFTVLCCILIIDVILENEILTFR